MRRRFARAESVFSLCRSLSQSLWAVLLLLLIAAESHAIDKFWDGGAAPAGLDGIFSDGANWDSILAPDATDVAHFGTSVGNFQQSSYTVSFSANRTNQALVVEDDNVTFDLNGRIYTTTGTNPITLGISQPLTFLAGQLTIMDGFVLAPSQSLIKIGASRAGFLTVTTGGLLGGLPHIQLADSANGTLTVNNNGDISASDVSIGSNTGRAGTAAISGNGSSLLTTALMVGDNGTGTLDISAGGDVDSDSAIIGHFSGSLGIVHVRDSGSTWDVSGSLIVGDSAAGTPGVTAGGTLNITAGGLVENTFGAIGSQSGSTGTVNVSDSNSRWLNSGNLAVGSSGQGTLNITGGRVENVNAIINDGGVGAVKVEGSNAQWINSGFLEVGHLGQGTLEIKAGGRVESASGIIGNDVDPSTVTVSGLNSQWINSGTLEIGKSGNGTLRIQPGATVSVAQNTRLFGNGRLRLEGGTLSTTEVSFQNGGQFLWSAGTLHVGIIQSDLFIPNGGVLAPGNSAGSTVVNGDYTQQTGATLAVEIGGTAASTQYDRVTVHGNAVLGGNLQLSMLDSFVPSSADRFFIFEANNFLGPTSVTGAFANVANGQRLTTSDGLGSFLIHYGAGSAFDPDQVVLSNFLSTDGLPGDFNHDGTVDAADYVVWRKGLGTVPTQENYNIWRNNFGRTAGSGASAAGSGSAAAPEPATFILLTLAAGIWFQRRQRS
jgi:T5SS/PEP-CTERM-associated repeat protein